MTLFEGIAILIAEKKENLAMIEAWFNDHDIDEEERQTLRNAEKTNFALRKKALMDSRASIQLPQSRVKEEMRQGGVREVSPAVAAQSTSAASTAPVESRSSSSSSQRSSSEASSTDNVFIARVHAKAAETSAASLLSPHTVRSTKEEAQYCGDDGAYEYGQCMNEDVYGDYADPVVNELKRNKSEAAPASRQAKRPIVSPDAEYRRSARPCIQSDKFDPSVPHVSIKEESGYKSSHSHRMTSSEETAQDIVGYNTLRSVYGAWKKVEGKGVYKDWRRYIYVNPQGVGYTMSKNPVLNVDFFLCAQDALDYCKVHYQPVCNDIEAASVDTDN